MAGPAGSVYQGLRHKLRLVSCRVQVLNQERGTWPWSRNGAAAITRMQDEILEYLSRHASEPVPSEAA